MERGYAGQQAKKILLPRLSTEKSPYTVEDYITYQHFQINSK
jgi:hypothetical protein